MGVMGERAHEEVGRTGRDGELVARVRRSRVVVVTGLFPGLSARRPWAELLRGPGGSAVRRSSAEAARCIRAVRRAGGAEGNLSGLIEGAAEASGHGERCV